ncbi:MAG: translation initiation factor [Bacteroidaceae bacterium]
MSIIYSTNPDFRIEAEETTVETLAKDKQPLRVSIERKGRGGKTVTLVAGFVGTDDDLKELGKWLKTACGVGGSVKDGEVILQGDLKQRATDLLRKGGYTRTR